MGPNNTAIVKLRLVEGTGRGEYVPHPGATTHLVEAKFELAENAAATLHKGDAVIVVGPEHIASWGPEGAKSYGRVVEADHIGVDLSRAVPRYGRYIVSTAARSGGGPGGGRTSFIISFEEKRTPEYSCGARPDACEACLVVSALCAMGEHAQMARVRPSLC